MSASTVPPPASELERRFYDALQQQYVATSGADITAVIARLKEIVELTKQGTKRTADPAYREVREIVRRRHVLLLCQTGRDDEAHAVLRKAGFVARLSPAVLRYASPQPSTVSPPSPSAVAHDSLPAAAASDAEPVPCVFVVDDAVSPAVLRGLDRVFAAVDAPYWTAHRYRVDPPTPYFSYAFEASRAAAPGSLGPLGAFVRAAVRSLARFKGAEAAARVKFVELWAHNRPHASGHQMHFDSDDEGRGGLRHPIASGVIYLTTGVGGPTVVTNQRRTDAALADRGWAAHPVRGRVVLFDGSVLHGVVPGHGLPPQDASPDADHAGEAAMQTGGSSGMSATGPRRVTAMLALWEDLRVRSDEPGHGSARPLPELSPETAQTHPWLEGLTAPMGGGFAEAGGERAVQPMSIDPVWCDLDGRPWDRSRGMPPYDKAFQGF